MGFSELQEFLDRGGPILVLFILPATFFMWLFILERFFYFRFSHEHVAQRALDEWNARADKTSMYASWIRDKLVSEVRQKAEAFTAIAKVFVALAPLLGLLGTVTGMVSVFDIMAITDGADAKAMAAGVSRATIPTMAGMVASISGIIFTSGMDRKVNRLVQQVEDKMETH
ncbi:MAG: MotA/TolQ/ExbB proton channel family protein [Pseudomonadota bacterium]